MLPGPAGVQVGRGSGGGWTSGRVVLIGSPGCRRVALFQEALRALGLPPARLMPWVDILKGRVDLSGAVGAGDLVRIESPGKDFAAECALIAAGADAAESEGSLRFSRRAALALEPDRGRLYAPRQWYLGLCEVLGCIRSQLSGAPRHVSNHSAENIMLMFDKRRCHTRLAAHGVPVPRALGPVHSHAELLDAMHGQHCFRVFVKSAHGSSASGVAAYATDGVRHQVTTTVEVVETAGETRLYNSRKLQVHRDPAAVARVLDELCAHRVHVEQWLPKAGLDSCAFDLRVVVIGGRARHVAQRLSRSPITNLHLLNRRGDPEQVRVRMPASRWGAALQACEQALAAFPGSHYAGLDLLFTPDYRSHAVLEANVFGDLLPGLLWEGQDTYTTELQDLLTRGAPSHAADEARAEQARC